jgi:hypothetical protein
MNIQLLLGLKNHKTQIKTDQLNNTGPNSFVVGTGEFSYHKNTKFLHTIAEGCLYLMH